jgi:phage FluMu protein gp41
MGEPFSAAPDPRSRRERLAEAEIKLVAAKEILLEEIAELGRAVPVVIFAFNSEAQEIFAGTAEERETIAARLASVEATNGTDIACALDAAADYKRQHGSSNVVRIVLISDGKSDVAKAVQAAQRCLEVSIGIHFILIDPTDEGKEFARQVVSAVGGTSQPVTSRSQLKESARDARQTLAAVQAKAEALLAQSAEEAASLRTEVRDRAQVEFTAGYPGRMSPTTQAPLFIYIHTEAMKAAVEQRLRIQGDQFGERLRSSDAEANSLIPLGTPLEVTPRIHQLAVSPTQQQVTWSGELEELSFHLRFSGPPGEQTISAGFVEITTSGLPIAQLPISIVVDPSKAKAKIEFASAKTLERIFASYSHQDADVVQACKAVYRALGIQLFVDKDNIPTGKEWWQVLRASIANHDLFQLFWSRTSANSSNVADEWRLALALRPAKGEQFLRPVYWERPMPAPPQELALIHFGYLDLETVDRHSSSHSGARQASSSATVPAVRADFPIIHLFDSDVAMVAALRSDIAEVVAFLEHLIDVRYYPPVTFLVDEHLIPSLKPTPQPSPSPATPAVKLDKEAAHLIALLQSLGLAFHVGKLTDKGGLTRDEHTHFFGAADPPAAAEFEHLRRMSEYVFAHPTREFLAGGDVWSTQWKSFDKVLRELADQGKGDGWKVVRMVEQLSAIASRDEQARIAGIVTKAEAEALQSFGDRASEREKRLQAARKLRDSELPRLAANYRIGLFFGQPDLTKLRFCRSFPDYIDGLCRQWIDFAEIALRKCSDKIVDVGYSAPDMALDWLKQHWPHIEIRNRCHSRYQSAQESASNFHLSLEDYKTCVQELAKRLILRLRKAQEERAQHLLPVMASTYGVYLSARAFQAQAQFEEAVERFGWPNRASLPGQDKVLVCLNALRRAENQFGVQGLDAAKVSSLVRRLGLSVLVHEHFHSAVARGLDGNGHPALGFERNTEWGKADALNEAFAVWCELHFFRHDSEMATEIEAYISSGEYPEWPYRGGEKIEELFLQGGIPAIRGWLRHLRDDPADAQRDFDQRLVVVSP